MWFPAERQGIPMGLWATWVPVGTVTTYALAPTMAATMGWQSVWWLGAIFSLLILVIYAIFMRIPSGMAADFQQNTGASNLTELASSLKALNNKSIWQLGFVFACFTLTFMGLGTFYPTFLVEVRGYQLSQASYIASISTMMVLISAPLAGWFSDRIGSRRLVLSIPFLVISVMMIFPFRIVGWQIYAFMIVQGLIAGAVPTATFAAAPEVMKKPALAGLGMAVVMFGQNMGMFIGPLLFGKLVDNQGWLIAGYCLIPFCLLGFFAGWKLKVR
jgi:nitrate/nitrite transporter NarK